MIIAVFGKKGSGKTTVAQIAAKKGYKLIAFADPLKLTCSKVFNIPESVLNDPIAKDNMQISISLNEAALSAFLWSLSNNYVQIHPSAIDEAVGTYKGPSEVYTPRQLLQVLGTDLVRDCVDKEYWVKAASAKIEPNNKYIFHDTRFENECDFVKNNLNGIILLVERAGQFNNDNHASEQFKPQNFDFKINNDSSLNDFYFSVLSTIELAEYQNGKKI